MTDSPPGGVIHRGKGGTMENGMGERIRALRLARGLTQDEFAWMIGPTVRKQNVSDWERGTRRPGTKLIARIAQEMGTTPAYIRYGEGRR